jgi:hypothetical protein
MTQSLDYEQPTHRPPSRVLRFFAHATAAYPVILLGALYGQWLLSWWMLGHRPQPSLDDPKYIDGANWMHIVTCFALLGFLPAACAAVTLNALYVVGHRLRGFRLFVRIAVVSTLWLGTFLLLRWDPGFVLYWWID